MSTSPDDGNTGRKPSAAGRYLFLFLLGLVAGVVATVMIVRAIQARADRFPDSVMQVQQWHLGQLRSRVEENRCSATDLLPHLRALRTMSDDLEPAFPKLRDDKRFAQHASHLRATLDAALASPPLHCAGLGATAKEIGEACSGCHRDFRG
ncbi:cytochrome c [Luteimonas suaedae]|uniref:cytochrome c n=1 Tax=Luteimonas suaedae TaxID=2605430 RepID=UPI0011EFBB5A|nr:cytochrome c [Luteimonas suaedae]